MSLSILKQVPNLFLFLQNLLADIDSNLNEIGIYFFVIMECVKAVARLCFAATRTASSSDRPT